MRCHPETSGFAMFIAVAFGLVASCNEPPPQNDGWPFGDRDGSSGDVEHEDVRDTYGDGTDPDAAMDTTVDASPDARSGEWAGWYRHGQTLQYFIDGSQATIATGGPGSGVAATCQVLFEPSSPKWGIEPAPSRDDLWRLRQPAATTDDWTRPPLSEHRIGFVDVSGELTRLLRPPVTGRVSDASTSIDTCKSLKKLERCGVPNAGDLCYSGIEPFTVEGPAVTLDVLPDGSDPRPNRLQYSLKIDFAPAVLDAGRYVEMVFSVPRYGPADGAQVDWNLSEVTDGLITRNCSAMGAVTTVEYPIADSTGWLRRIRAHERDDSTRNLLVVNLKTGVGQLAQQSSPRPDAGEPPFPSCSTAPMEFWFGVEYARNN